MSTWPGTGPTDCSQSASAINPGTTCANLAPGTPVYMKLTCDSAVAGACSDPNAPITLNGNKISYAGAGAGTVTSTVGAADTSFIALAASKDKRLQVDCCTGTTCNLTVGNLETLRTCPPQGIQWVPSSYPWKGANGNPGSCNDLIGCVSGDNKVVTSVTAIVLGCDVYCAAQ